MVYFLLLCYRQHSVTIRTTLVRCTLKLKNTQCKGQLLYIANNIKEMFALWNATTYRLHKRFEKEMSTKMRPLNKRCVVLTLVVEATGTPDEIMLTIMQSFSSQLSGFLSLLLLKRCFEIWLPFEVSWVQHDIYLRYKPNCLLSRSQPLFLSEPLLPFPKEPHPFFPQMQERHQRDATTQQPSSPRSPCVKLVGPPLPHWDPSPCPPLPRPEEPFWRGGEGEEKSLLRRRQAAD